MPSFRDIQQDCEVIVKDLRECLKDHFRDPKVNVSFTLLKGISITCLVSEILKDKDTKYRPSWKLKKSITSQAG